MPTKSTSIRFLCFTCVCILLLLSLHVAQASLEVQEIDLGAGGQPWEANLDSSGMLWVSQVSPGEIWQIDTQSGTIHVYPVGGEPSDGRGDGAGRLWWADIASNKLSRLNTNGGQVDTWQIPGSNGLYTTAIDAAGQVWAMDYWAPSLYRLDPQGNQLCVYTLPDGGLGNYMDSRGQALWFGDATNARIVRLDYGGAGGFTWWQLPDNSYPLDIALDPGNGVWWTDTSNGSINRLAPGLNEAGAFDLPGSYDPQSLAPAEGSVWFSYQDAGNPGGLGRLDMAASGVISTTLTTGSQAAAVTCAPLAPASSSSLQASTQQASWSAENLPRVDNAGGLMTFRLPDDGLPYGLAAGDKLWLVDQGRGKLARLDYPQAMACKLQDADGSLATSNDQSPLPGQPVYLRINGIKQSPGKMTGADGCATWSGLQPGMVYGVEEDVLNGWNPLTPSSLDFSPYAAGRLDSYTFIGQPMQAIYLPVVLR